MAAEAESAPERRVVVIGASAGGVEALGRLASMLPRGFSLPIFVVLHVPPTNSVLPQILTRAGSLPAVHARDLDAIADGQITIAPPDFHLLLSARRVHLTRGPKENGHRPAVDPLFRSAASTHGPGVVAIVLSGALDDGAVGLATVKAAGGLTVAQNPDEALYPSMPARAIAAARPDHVLPLTGIAELLASLDSRPGPDPAQSRDEEGSTMGVDPTQMEPEKITEANRARGELSPFTCPECSGSLWEIREGAVVKLRCRVGHSYTEDAYRHEKSVALEAALWTAVTALAEKSEFSRRLAQRLRDGGHQISAERYEHDAATSLAQSELVREAVLSFETPHPVEEAEAS